MKHPMIRYFRMNRSMIRYFRLNCPTIRHFLTKSLLMKQHTPKTLQIYLLPEIPFRSLLTVDLQTLFSKNGFPKTLIQIATGFSLTRKSPCAQKSVFLPCQSIPWKASNIFIIWKPWTVLTMNCCFSMYQPTQFWNLWTARTTICSVWISPHAKNWKILTSPLTTVGATVPSVFPKVFLWRN